MSRRDKDNYEIFRIGTYRYIEGIRETLIELRTEYEETGEIEGPTDRLLDLIEECEDFHNEEHKMTRR